MNPHPKPQFSISSSQSGFTLIESLMAIIVVAVLMAAIAPVLVLSTANRVQAKRVERATSAAKQYIDGVRSGVYDPPPITVLAANADFPTIAAPRGGNLRCNNIQPKPSNPQNYRQNSNGYCEAPTPTATYQLFCVDGDGDRKCTAGSQKDMVIQAFGYQHNTTTTPSADLGYKLGIRVYRADAFQENGSLQISSGGSGFGRSNTPTKAQARTYTGGLGSRTAPQVELTTGIVNSSTNYSGLCTLTNGTSANCQQ